MPPGKENEGRMMPRQGVVVRDGRWFADALARIAAQTVFAAVAGDAAMLRAMKENGKHTAGFDALLRDAKHLPPEVRAWVEREFQVGGRVQAAIASEVQIAFERFRAAEGLDKGASLADVSVIYPGSDPHVADGPNCSPLCPPPLPP